MENKTKKSKLKKETKEKIFKILHFISYVLSIIFIIVCIGVGVNSCKGNNKQSNKPQQNLVVEGTYYVLSYDDIINKDLLNDIFNYVGNNQTLTNVSGTINIINSITGTNYTNFGNLEVYSTDLGTKKYISLYRSGSYSTFSRIYIQYTDEGHVYLEFRNNYNNTQYPYNLNNIVFTTLPTGLKSIFDNYITSDSGGYTEEEVEEMTSQAYDEGYSLGYDEGYSLGYDEGYSLGYEEGYQYAEGIYNTSLDEIIINYAYDFRSLLCTNVDSQTGAMYFNTAFVDSTPIIKDLYGLTFLCNSNRYNFIRLSYMPLDSTDALFYDATNNLVIASEFFGSTNYLHYAKLMNVYYGYYDEDLEEVTTIDKVYNGIQFEQGSYSGTNTIGQDLRNPKFLNNSFRYIKILENTGERVNVNGYGANYTLAQILAFDGQVATTNDSMFSMFSLFSSAFGSISGLLSIAILPNITLGLLMFIPLFVGIIVIIIRTIKK